MSSKNFTYVYLCVTIFQVNNYRDRTPSPERAQSGPMVTRPLLKDNPEAAYKELEVQLKQTQAEKQLAETGKQLAEATVKVLKAGIAQLEAGQGGNTLSREFTAHGLGKETGRAAGHAFFGK